MNQGVKLGEINIVCSSFSTGGWDFPVNMDWHKVTLRLPTGEYHDEGNNFQSFDPSWSVDSAPVTRFLEDNFTKGVDVDWKRSIVPVYNSIGRMTSVKFQIYFKDEPNVNLFKLKFDL